MSDKIFNKKDKLKFGKIEEEGSKNLQRAYGICLLVFISFLILLSPLALSQGKQSHPLSQITPIDVILNMSNNTAGISQNITGVGYLGIGIVGLPSYRLDVAGSAWIRPELFIGGGWRRIYDTGTMLGIDSSLNLTGNLQIGGNNLIDSGGTTRLTLGNTLVIAGSTNLNLASGDLQIGETSVITSARNIVNVNWVNATDLNVSNQLCLGGICKASWPASLVGGSGTAYYIPIWTASDTLGNSVIYQSGGNIGIGTTAPIAKLFVKTTDLTTVPFQVEALVELMPGWSYRKPITINNTGSALNDYQVLVNLDTAGLISAGKMRSDCGDIRFTDGDGATLLNYWIESGCNSANTKIWVKVPSIPASSTKTIYVYYGNPSATSQSNGRATFMFFDDFSSGADQWTELAGTWAVENGEYSQNDTGPEWYNHISVAGSPSWNDYIVEAKMKIVDGNSVGLAFRVQNAGNWYMAQLRDDSNRIEEYNGGSLRGMCSCDDNAAVGVWYYTKVVVAGNTFSMYVNDALCCSYTDTTFSQGKIGLSTYGAHGHFDDVRVRKYASQEPTTSVGNEETLPIPTTTSTTLPYTTTTPLTPATSTTTLTTTSTTPHTTTTLTTTSTKEFKVREFNCVKSGNSYSCMIFYENNYGRNVYLVFFVSDTEGRTVTNSNIYTLQPGSGSTPSYTFSCSGRTGDYYIYWTAYEDSNLRNPKWWPPTNEWKRVTC